MAASDKAFVDSMNASRRGRLNEDAAVKQEERQVTLDERQDKLFNRQTSLYEQQQKLFKDEQAKKKLGEEVNAGIAMWRASHGQIFQPMLTAYEKVPDGGKMHTLSRNEDGTFKIDMEWDGQRFKKDDVPFSEMSKMMMSFANPVTYLEQSGATALAELEHNNAKELEQIKALNRRSRNGTQQPLMFGGKLTTRGYYDGRKQFKEEYDYLMQNEPDSLGEGDDRINLEEFIAGKFLKTMGIDITGVAVQDDGTMKDMSPPDATTASINDIRQYLLSSGKADSEAAATASVIEMLTAENGLRRPELAEKMLKSPDAYGLTKSQTGRLKGAYPPDGKEPEEDVDALKARVESDDKDKQGVVPDKSKESEGRVVMNPRTGKPYPGKYGAKDKNGVLINPNTGKAYPVNAFYENVVKPFFRAWNEKNIAISGKPPAPPEEKSEAIPSKSPAEGSLPSIMRGS